MVDAVIPLKFITTAPSTRATSRTVCGNVRTPFKAHYDVVLRHAVFFVIKRRQARSAKVNDDHVVSASTVNSKCSAQRNAKLTLRVQRRLPNDMELSKLAS